MRIGLFGGTFNPIHNGHLQIAEKVLSRLKLDRVFFIPTGTPAHKPNHNMASKDHRRNMIALALKGHAHFALCDIEIKRRGISYTVDTISSLKQIYPHDSFFFIIGTDAFLKLPEWKDPERLLALCPFAVVPRLGTPFSSLLPLQDSMNVTFVRMRQMSVSASEIRARIREKKSVDTLLPKIVLSYIIREGIYR